MDKQHERLLANFEKSKNGNVFTDIAAFLSAATDGKPQFVGRKTKVANIPCAIDIETTSFMNGDIPCGTMYLFSMCINGAVYQCRTWPDVLKLFSAVVSHYEITPERRIRFYSRNFGFEFQFMRRWFEWADVYAREPRSTMSAVTVDGIEFRCSYYLTNQKLEVSANDLIELKVNKLVGELDYRVIRHSQTPILPNERQYAINDVLIDVSLINDRIHSDGSVAKIPLTATGYVRKLFRSNCLHKNPRKGAYMRQMANLTMTEPEYICAKLCFAGGYTHASPLTALIPLTDVASLDFTSAYPANMCAEREFPMSKGYRVDASKIVSRETLLQMSRDFAFIGIFEFVGLNSRVEFDYYLSSSKLLDADGVEAFNGRVAKCTHCKIGLTHIDFQVVMQLYRIKKMRVVAMWVYRKDYLPEPYIDTVLTLYEKKTQLKGVVGMEAEYMAAKRDCNSAYGALVTAVDRPDVVYSDEWQIHPCNTVDRLTDYNDSDTRYYSYLWGIMVTALCRRNLWLAILECREDYHYSDTDSVKITNYEDHAEYFKAYNADVDRKLKAMCDHYGIDFARTRPRTIKGVEKPLGHWDFEEVYPRFKALNAKRYIYTDASGALHVTIAGTGKKTTAEYLLYKFGSVDAVFEKFDNGLRIVGECIDKDGNKHGGTGKLTHIYNDTETVCSLTDYTGITADVHELSSIYLEPCDYCLNFTEAFMQFLSNMNRNMQFVPKL